MSKFVLVITGPAGSGKSAVAKKLASSLDKCANIDADHIKHMIYSGFSYKLLPDGTKKWAYSEWALVGESIGLLAKNFQEHSFDVIINGYIDPPGWENIEKQIAITHKVLLLPDVATTIHRDSLRLEDYPMGKNIVKMHHDHFSKETFYKDFTKVDTTNLSVEETASKIKTMLIV